MILRRQRKPDQSGWIKDNRGLWIGHYYEYKIDPVQGKRRRYHRTLPEPIGKVASMSEDAALKRCHKLVHAIVAQQTGTRDGRVSFKWFVVNEFIPVRLGGWAARTEKTNRDDLDRYIYPLLEKLPLELIDEKVLTAGFMDKLGERGANYSEAVIRRCKTLVSSIMFWAQHRKFILANPADPRIFKLPTHKETERPHLQLRDVGRLWKAISDLRVRLIIRIASVGCNQAETLGLRRRDVHLFDRCFEINSSAYNGELRVGKVKRKQRRRKIGIPEEMFRDFAAYLATIDESPDTLLFPQDGKERKGKPKWGGILLQDHVYPIATKLGIEIRPSFQVLRRTFVTWMRRGIDQIEADLQDVVGHARGSSTTARVYDQDDPKKELDLVQIFERLCYAHAARFEKEATKKRKAPKSAIVAARAERGMPTGRIQ